MKVEKEAVRQGRRNTVCEGVEIALWIPHTHTHTHTRPTKKHNIARGYVGCGMW